MDDSISRQAAIDEIDEWIKAFLENRHKESAADARLIKNGIIQLPSAHPDYKTDHGFMWLCPKCGLPVHSDYEKCVRCGYER